MSATLIFNESGRNKKYVSLNSNKPKEEILEKLARESFSTFNSWPQESPKAGYYDTKNSATKLILLNNNKKWSHLRGKTKAKQPKLVKDNNYEWVEIEKMKQSQFPKSKALGRSQSSRSVDPARHLTPRHCTFKAEYDDTLMLPVDMKKHNDNNKTSSRLFSSLTKSKFDEIDELEWLAYLHAMGVRTTGYQTYYKKPTVPFEYRSSYNLNHPKFDRNYRFYLSELYNSYSMAPLKNLKQLQYMTLLKQRKEIDRNCRSRYRFHRGDDFYTYEDHLAKARPVPHQVNMGHFSKRRVKSAKPGRKGCASPRPSKDQLYDTYNCEEAKKSTQNQSNSEISRTQLEQSIVNPSDSLLDSSLNEKNNNMSSSRRSSATKMTSSSKISLVKASSRTYSSSSSSSSSSESGSPRPVNRSPAKSGNSSASSKPKVTLTNSSSQSPKHIKLGSNTEQAVLPSRPTTSSSSSMKSRKNSSPTTTPRTSPKASGAKIDSARKSWTNRTPTPDPFNRTSAPHAKTEPTLTTLNSNSPSSKSSTPKIKTESQPARPASSSSSSSSSSSALSPVLNEKPVLKKTVSNLSTSSSSKTPNPRVETTETKRGLSKFSSSSSSKTPTPVQPVAQNTARSSSSSRSSSSMTNNKSSQEKPQSQNARRYESSSASSLLNKNSRAELRKKTPDSLDRLMKKPLESSDTD